jgi:hypothetical protein
MSTQNGIPFVTEKMSVSHLRRVKAARFTNCATRLATRFFLGSLFDHEDGGDMFLPKVCQLSTNHVELYPKRYDSTSLSLERYRALTSLGTVNRGSTTG